MVPNPRGADIHIESLWLKMILNSVVDLSSHCYGSVTHVKIGRFDLDNDSEDYEKLKVQEEIPHPYFDIATTDNDFILLKLEQPSNYTAVMIDGGGSVNLIDGQGITVIGWGKTSFSIIGSFSNVLLEVEVDC